MAKKISNVLPEYKNPPLTEVVCGITFTPMDNLIATHLGILWGAFQPDFPRAEEFAPLASQIEIVGEQVLQGKMQFTEVPPLPRQMFLSDNERNVIQVQRDKFLFNWRKLKLDDAYPRYKNVFSSYKEKLEIFEKFLIDGEMQIAPVQYELTYVNQISECDVWKSIDELANVFPTISLNFEEGLIPSKPENANFRISFLLPDKLGRLHATIKTGATRKVDGKKIIVFDLTARGISNETGKKGMEKWFDVAHEWIVKGFTDLTSKEMQEKIWKRRK